MMSKTVVISVGGSIINPGTINTPFLERLKTFVTNSPLRFILICGGGINARTYMAAAKTFGVKGDSLDYIGIQATLLNAELLRHIFNAPQVQQQPKTSSFKKVLVAGGWEPGCSTDYDAVLFALKYKSDTIINLTNVDYVYTKDPKEPGAEPLKCISWADYRSMISSKWSSGLHAPFDPIASKSAQKHNLRVLCINGERLSEIEKALAGKPFIGTVIG